MDLHFFDEGQLLDLDNDDIVQEDYMEDVELEGINVATRENKNGLWVVPQEHRLEVLHQHYDSSVVGHWEDTRLKSWSDGPSHGTCSQKI